MLFSKRNCILWPQKSSLDVFLDSREDNIFSFDLNLWQSLPPANLKPLADFLKSKHVAAVSVLVPDDVVVTKSFVYDAKIEAIGRDEVAKLANGATSFDFTPEAINFRLYPADDKTIIEANISNLSQVNLLRQNLFVLGFRVTALETVSGAIAKAIATFFPSKYFLLYPQTQNDFLLLLAMGSSVYLTSYLKKSPLSLQKLINYSKLYFGQTVTKIFLPAANPPEISSTSSLDKTFYDPVQIAASLKRPANFPLPVLGLLLAPHPPQSAIITTVPEETLPAPETPAPRNLLPIIAVFVVTAALASIVIWFVLNRNQSITLEEPGGLAVPTLGETPIATPTPTVAEISKTLKIQVLNATDINGQAATLKAILVGLGFENITVGNSQEKLTANEVRLKPALTDAGSYFQNKLAASFPATYSATLKQTSTYDAVFVIGVRLSASPSP